MSIAESAVVGMNTVGVIGIAGRMGQSIYDQCTLTEHIRCLGGFDQRMPEKGMAFASIGEVFAQCDWVVDFSSPSCTLQVMREALLCPKPLLVGTTGVPEIEQQIAHLSQYAPIIFCANASLGACLQGVLAAQLCQSLPGYDIDIVEEHHRQKIDCPSGTALALAQKMAGIRAASGEKTKIPIASLRRGQLPGTHRIEFTGPYDSITLTHTVFHRDLFAQGVVTLLTWLSHRPPGLYTIEDALVALDLLHK